MGAFYFKYVLNPIKGTIEALLIYYKSINQFSL